MNLGIVGTGAMGQVLYEYAKEEGTFENCYLIEPIRQNPWPNEQLDLLIDFSHPKAISKIYEYCRQQGGNIPVVLATTGYGPEEEKVIELLGKICPLDRSSNYSTGIGAMEQLCMLATELLGEKADVRIVEAHHTKKKDAPSGTALTLARAAGIERSQEQKTSELPKILSLRMGTVFGEHSVYFALEDEIIELKHTALSKRIFAIGALEAGKALLGF
ncbi:MAG: 4-hydroxy-tetrahydrodipicolinate reductase [Firmicutes bacterium]|nr:4-hydroxy-tetrahydrodipicolinate reductase [Bacillota bacterium]